MYSKIRDGMSQDARESQKREHEGEGVERGLEPVHRMP